MSMPLKQYKNLNGLKKAAILLVSLGPELSAKVFRHLGDDEIERISLEIANTTQLPTEIIDEVVSEFLDLNDAQQFLMHGGIKYAREVLEKSVGSQRANEIIKKLVAASRVRPFANIRKTDPKQLLNFISHEHPQTIALVLSHLDSEQAAVILGSLPEEQQSDVARRIAIMERTSPEVIREVESVLEKKLISLASEDFTSSGGIKVLVDILNRVDRGTEKVIIETLEQDDHSLAEEIRQRMFVFEDIITLDDASVRRVLRDVDQKDLALGLKGSSAEVSSKIFNNLSKRAGEMLKEEIDFLGPIRLRDVEEAQQRIVKVIRRLDEAGEIIIWRGGEDSLVV